MHGIWEHGSVNSVVGDRNRSVWGWQRCVFSALNITPLQLGSSSLAGPLPGQDWPRLAKTGFGIQSCQIVEQEISIVGHIC